MEFKVHSAYTPAGDQPDAIHQLTKGILEGEKYQTLLGVTGSGKTFTVAKVIEQVQRPTLVLTHNKTLVAQLYGEPDSKSPSSKGGQQLELFYYAFDWAGPDVPQVMTVLCTPEGDGKPGRVVEITLAAPSL